MENNKYPRKKDFEESDRHEPSLATGKSCLPIVSYQAAVDAFGHKPCNNPGPLILLLAHLHSSWPIVLPLVTMPEIWLCSLRMCDLLVLTPTWPRPSWSLKVRPLPSSTCAKAGARPPWNWTASATAARHGTPATPVRRRGSM